MSNENEIIETNYVEMDIPKDDVSSNDESSGNGEYRFKSSNNSPKKKKRKFPFKTVLIAGVIGVSGFYLGQVTSRYGIEISIVDKNANLENEQTSTLKLNNEDEADLVFNQTEQEVVTEESIESENAVSSNAIQEASKSVVSVSAKIISQNGLLPTLGQSAGSAVIVAEDDDNIYMLTNNHVVQGANIFAISFDDENYVDTRVLGTDPAYDIAVIYTSKDDLEDAGIDDYTLAKIGNSDDLELTDKVYAIGNSAGEGKSVTSGVVSALDKTVTFNDGTSQQFIQTDAAINPGNSGGALVDENGYLVGINTAKLVDSTIEGMGYSIPINTAIEVADELVNKPYMGIQGISVEDLAEGDLTKIGLPNGVYVDAVIADSGADDAGMKAGDIIVEANGEEIKNFDDLGDVLDDLSIGDEMEVVVFRKGENVKLDVILGSRAN